MRRTIVSLLLAVACLIPTAPAIPVAAAPGADGLCRLLTVKEVRKALGKGKWQIADDGDVADQCYMHNGLMDRKSRAFSMRLLASNEDNQAEYRDDRVSSGATELTIAGFPAVQDRRDAVTVFFPDPWDMLQLSPVGYEDQDVAERIRQLAELAAGVYAAEAGTSAAASEPPPVASGSVPSGGPATACALLTLDEASDAMGEQARLGIDVPEQCLFSTDNAMLQVVILTAGADQTASMIDRRKERSSDATPAQVGGYPALVEVGPLMGVPTVYVYPSEDVELSIDLVTAQEIDAQAVLLGLAEVAVGRLVELGLPVPPTPVPTLEPGTGLCSILSADEASTALGGALITNTVSDADACTHVTDEQDVSVYLVILRGDQAASVHEGVSMAPDQFDLAGMPAVQMDPGANEGRSASMVYFLPDESTAAYVAVSAPEDVDAATTTRALAETVAPRLKTYLGQ